MFFRVDAQISGGFRPATGTNQPHRQIGGVTRSRDHAVYVRHVVTGRPESAEHPTGTLFVRRCVNRNDNEAASCEVPSRTDQKVIFAPFDRWTELSFAEIQRPFSAGEQNNYAVNPCQTADVQQKVLEGTSEPVIRPNRSGI